MTEQEWLTGYDPQAMLEWLGSIDGGRSRAQPDGFVLTTNRKLRLFACACCRQVWHLLEDVRSRNSVEVAERFAEGHVGQLEMDAARGAAWDAARDAAWAAAWAAVWVAARDAARDAARGAAWAALRSEQTILLRDIFGNPFRTISLLQYFKKKPIGPFHIDGGIIDEGFTRESYCPWLTWNNGIVRKIAQSIYDERRFEDMSVLADALEEAGCANLDLIGHLRGWERCSCLGENDDCKRCVRNGVTTGMVYTSNPHVLGCWVLDLLLGKE